MFLDLTWKKMFAQGNGPERRKTLYVTSYFFDPSCSFIMN